MKKLSLLLMSTVIAGGLSAQKITTNGTGTAGDIYHLGGKIGIGTDDPKSLVHAKDSVDSWQKILIENRSNSGSGVAAFHAKTATGGFYMLATPENYYDPIHADRAVIYGAGQDGFNFVSSQAGSDIQFYTSGFNATNQRMIITGNGAVGIGTSTPESALHVLGNAKISSNLGLPAQLLLESSGAVMLRLDNTSTNGGDYSLTTGSFGKEFYIVDNNTSAPVMTIKNGQMIIGDGATIPTGPDATYKLAVDGQIVAKSTRVQIVDWSDFVFEDDYDLMPLSEVESFISNNNHLPNVPSEEEVKTNGSDLGQMDAILLRKIEELTLYVIELEKKISTK